MTCNICGQDGSLIEANHKEKGKIMVCRECWVDMYGKNEIVSGRSCSSCGGSCGSCGF